LLAVEVRLGRIAFEAIADPIPDPTRLERHRDRPRLTAVRDIISCELCRLVRCVACKALHEIEDAAAVAKLLRPLRAVFGQIGAIPNEAGGDDFPAMIL